jgi:superfamily I DNA and RNA helicase
LEEFLVTDIREQHRLGEFQLSEIAILYDDKLYGPEGFRYKGKEVPIGILKKLESAGIPTNWVSQDIRAKELFDITTDRVSLISIHSAKGLDFDLVYLVGVDQIIPTDETRDRLIRLIYVAITRAKYRLVIPYVEETEFIKRMKDCLTR